MQRRPRTTLLLTLLSLSTLSLVAAHGDEASTAHAGMDMSADIAAHVSHSAMQMGSPSDYMVEPSYWRHSEHSGLMYTHILLMIVSWVIILPIGVMLSIARSRITTLVQIAFLIVNGIGVLASMIYNHKIPDLYEHNAHHKLGWITTWLAVLWITISMVKTYARHGTKAVNHQTAMQPVTQQAIADHQRMQDIRKIQDYRWSHDSGQGTERNTESLCSSSRSASVNSETRRFTNPRTYSDNEENDLENEFQDFERQGFLHGTPVNRFLARAVPQVAKALIVLDVLFVVLERLMTLLGFLGLITGTVVYAGIFRGSDIFNGLAHFVKGGIFFWYGLLTFGRWMGCFANFGWAWNIKPGAEIGGFRQAWMPSAEFTESFVIFLYGASNVFMEHIAAWGEAWSPMDLEHVSISIMFFGGGLLGMLIESPRIRNVLNSTLPKLETDNLAIQEVQKWQAPKSYVHSLNPLPALVIMLLGIMMSSHSQDSSVSSAIHKQWGSMFVIFAIARGVTYVTLWLKPPTSYMPSRPPTEIITSFCLISGGIIFMASNRDTVAALEHYQLHAMFIFTITMGLVCLLMAWVVVVVAVKGWAARREQTSQSLPVFTSEA